MRHCVCGLVSYRFVISGTDHQKLIGCPARPGWCYQYYGGVRVLQVKTAGPYLTTKVKSSPKISAPVVFNMKRNATKTYVSTREYIKTQENYVAGVKDVFGSQALPPAGSQLCCGVKALKAYDSYLRLKCVPSNLDVSGWINACKGVRGLFTYGPFCQTSQTVCVMPKSIKK